MSEPKFDIGELVQVVPYGSSPGIDCTTITDREFLEAGTQVNLIDDRKSGRLKSGIWIYSVEGARHWIAEKNIRRRPRPASESWQAMRDKLKVKES